MTENQASDEKPVYTVRQGLVEASVWERCEAGTGMIHHEITVNKVIQVGAGEWVKSSSYSRADMPFLSWCVEEAQGWVNQREHILAESHDRPVQNLRPEQRSRITTPDVQRAIHRILDYLWRDESRHYQETEQGRGHIFEDLSTVDRWLGGERSVSQQVKSAELGPSI